MKVINIGLVVAAVLATTASGAFAQAALTKNDSQSVKIVSFPTNEPGQNDPWAPPSGPVEDLSE